MLTERSQCDRAIIIFVLCASPLSLLIKCAMIGASGWCWRARQALILAPLMGRRLPCSHPVEAPIC